MKLLDLNSPLSSPQPRRGSDNLVLLLLPPREIAEKLRLLGETMRSHHSPWGSLRPTDHLHVTLFHFGNFAGLPADIVATAMQACAATAVASQPFVVRMDQAACWGKEGGNIPLVVSVRGRNSSLDQLHQRATIQCSIRGLRSTKKSKFNPHVTLAYLKDSFSTETIEPISWMAEEIVLIHSLMGQTKYIKLGRWNLGTQSQAPTPMV
ncbi:2'-5' RNA ligase family protein [Luteolibacter soli]|uniref:2'-5' RNA ligase family protein n=1 Tax=Luteolibacter soli TaxID=3135280 RepID=A0ABU9AZW4_9BACT